MMVVTGVHRSGTSAVAMALRALGVDFGPVERFYGADRWNERGYLERVDVIDLNSRLLTGFPRTRDPFSSLAAQMQYMLLPSAEGIGRRAQGLREEIAELGSTLDGMAVKDPRFCLTFEAWQECVTDVIVCLRHPLAVAQSLRRRQHVPLPLGLRFWNHHAEGLLGLPMGRTLFVDFDALTHSYQTQEMSRILGFLGLEVTLDEGLAALREQLSPSLRHFAAEGVEELPDKTRGLWDALQKERRV